MKWVVKYLPEIHDDLAALDATSVKRVEKVIEDRIINGSPDQSGKPLRYNLSGCRRIRTGDIRIVYKVFEKEIMVLVVAVGMRRNDEIYNAAKSRKPKGLTVSEAGAIKKAVAVKKKAVKKKAPRR